MGKRKPVLTVTLASFRREVRCKKHGHTGDLPCPWPGCEEGVEYDEFYTRLIGINKVMHSYYRRKWSSLNGEERYCWDLADDTSWFMANKLVWEEVARLIPQSSVRPNNLYHYTNMEGLFGIVSSNHLWLTDYEFLNDSSELKFSLEVANKCMGEFDAYNYSARVANLLPEWRKHLELTIPTCKLYVASFSEDRDNLSLWRAYSPAEGGVSLGFEFEFFSLLLQSGSSINRVTYSAKEQQMLINIAIHLHLLSIDWDLEKSKHDYERQYELRKGFFSHNLLRQLAFIKDPSFADEKEIRVAYIEDQELFDREGLKKATRRFRPRGRLIVPYITSDEDGVGAPTDMDMDIIKRKKHKLPLEEVVISPQPDSPLVARSIREFLVAHNFRDTKVVPSAIPFRRL